MKKQTKLAINEIKSSLKLSRLDPRRLFIVDDGAYKWIGDRADLTQDNASKLYIINRVATRPDLATREERDISSAATYDQLCRDIPAIAATCGGGLVTFDDLPEDWQDGDALGPISPL